MSHDRGTLSSSPSVAAEIRSEETLAAVAHALGAAQIAGMSRCERALGRGGSSSSQLIDRVRAEIATGDDPLGSAFCRLRTARVRRTSGAIYTPWPIVESMLSWACRQAPPGRVIDPGAGSGRFLVAAGLRFPRAELLAVEVDPLAALLCRAHLAVRGFADRCRVVVSDYRSARVVTGSAAGSALYIGNPPYVRHHQLEPRGKAWLVSTAAKYGLKASRLAGLHAHFFLATVEHARDGDFGAFITSSEWLDVNYGKLIRELFLDRLGGLSLHLIEPTAQPFPDATTTAVITCFRIGRPTSAVQIRRVARPEKLGSLGGGRAVPREHFAAAPRWTALVRGRRRVPRGYVELGELCRVHRGQVTGANKFWIA
ncbi:MAG: class I SAM-dependent methyltransferase, partial [Myxococcota bacterium]